MFSLFKKQDSIPFIDKVWKTRPALMKGMSTEAMKAIQQKNLAIIVFWFEDKKKSFLNFCEQMKVPHETLEGATLGNTPSMYWIDAAVLGNSLSVMTKLSGYSIKGKINFFVDGHYPLIGREINLLEKLKALNRSTITLTFCQSLDGAFLQQFGGDRMVALLEQLGLKEDECLEHSMITTSIKRAREKLSQEVVTEISGHSEEDWFSKNRPQKQ